MSMKQEVSFRATPGNFINEEVMRRFAPAIFAEEAKHDRSDRYTFIPTSSVLGAMTRANFLPTAVMSKRSKTDDGRLHTTHLIRFQMPNMQARQVGDTIPEIVLKNAHDGSSSYQLMIGFFRLVCSNGLIICDSQIGQLNVRHTGRDTAEHVVTESRRLIEQMPEAIGQIQLMQRAELNPGEQHAFAKAAASIRWEGADAPITADQILRARRHDDQGNDVWHTFNRVQENLTKGGQDGRASTGRRLRTRAVQGLDTDVKLNRGLWTLAHELAKLKTGQASALAVPPVH